MATLARYQGFAQDNAGNVLPSASVEVRLESSGALVQLYSDRAGTATLGNPFNADAEGFFGFHVAGGAYKITVTSGAVTRTLRYVGIGTYSEMDVDGSTGTWSPTFTVVTPGDLVPNYATRVGYWTRIGNLVFMLCDLTLIPTFTTASGQVTITGFPFTMDEEYIWPLSFNGITKAGYTQFWLAGSPGSNAFAIECGASATTISSINISNFTSGAGIVIRSTGFIRIP